MSYQSIIDRLLEEGFNINIGPHSECKGYYVGVFKDEDSDERCEACDHSIKEDLWHYSGHGFTIEEALLNAELIAKGQEPNKKYDPKDFDITSEGAK